MSIFMPCRRSGKYWEYLEETLKTIEKINLNISANEERKFEDRIAGALQLRLIGNL